MGRPNFLIVVVDTAQSGAYAVNGGQARTPHAERIAREGMRFTSAYTVSPICHPARAAILTGLFPRGCGIITNAIVHGWYPFKLLNGVQSFAEVLGEAGYRCGYAGQWHVQDVRGFHDNRAVPTKQHGERLKARGIVEQVQPDRRFKGCGRLSIGLEETREAEFARTALQLLDEYARLDQPWLIECDFDGPHPPCNVPAPYDTMYDPAAMRLPAHLHDPLDDRPYVVRLSRRLQGTASWSEADWRTMLAHYYGNITMLDDLFGRLLNRLDELRLAEDTVVVFTSDHGGMLGTHGFLYHGTPAMFDEVLRVPLFVRVPRVASNPCHPPPGAVCDEFVSHVDLLPTLAEMAGRRKEETRLARQRRGLATSKPCHPTVKTHGRSLAPLLHGQRANDWRDEVYASYDGDGVSFYTERVVRTRRAKLVYHAYGEHELYDLAADPLEMRNRFNDPARAHLKADLARQLWEWLKRVEDPVARAVGRDLRVK